MHEHCFSGKEATFLEAEIRLEAVNLFSGEVCDDLVTAGAKSLARDKEEEGAKLRVRRLTPWIPAPIRPPDEDCALLLAVTEKTLPAVIGTRKPPVH